MTSTLNSQINGIHSRGYLPHVKRAGTRYFVTFRLADSLPNEVLLDLTRQREERRRQLDNNDQKARAESERERLRQIERWLDQGTGECFLRRPDIAEVVADALQHFDRIQYLLDEWVVMPNHVHLVLRPLPNHSLSDILRSRKRHTARQANLLLGRTGERF